MNKTILIGRFVKDGELKFTPGNGTAVYTNTIAVNRRKKEDGADFIPVVIWGKQAEATAKYSGKGKMVSVSGRIQTRNYDNKEGKKVYITEVVVEEIDFLEWKDKDATDLQPDITPADSSEIPF